MLDALQHAGGAGRAEGEPLEHIGHGFYPVAAHLRMLDPDVVLVVGPRGAGKTEIARVLTDAALYDAVRLHAPAVRLPAGTSVWRRGYPLGKTGFEVTGFREFVRKYEHNPDALREMWLAYLVRVVADKLTPGAQGELRPLSELSGAMIMDVYEEFCGLGTRVIRGLDELDDDLVKRNEYIFITYDELDTLGAGDWHLVEAGVRGLVALWAAYARRWQRIRAKVFLRSDLYERHARLGGADLAKLAAGRVELTWNERDLYGLLIKRLTNASEDLLAYTQSVKSIKFQDDPALGWIPMLTTWQDAAPLLERMAGTYMGANQKKGLVVRWLLDHVRDGLGRAFPRPFVRLVEEAARLELQSFVPLKEPRLIRPVSLRRALDRVSEDHVAQSRDEWPWLDTVQKALVVNSLVPWNHERVVISLLEHLPQAAGSAVPPCQGRELFTYLLELGILRRRSDGRVDVSDLFLAGLKLRRRGGVRKKL